MKTEQDFFDEIENVLYAHEDAYVPGAWEDFVKKRKHRPALLFLRIAAAATVLLIAGYAVWLFLPQPVLINQHQTKNTTKPPYTYPENTLEDNLATKEAIVSQKSGNNSPVSVAPVVKNISPTVNNEPFAAHYTIAAAQAVSSANNVNQHVDIPNNITGNAIAVNQPAKADSAAIPSQSAVAANTNAAAAAVIKTEPKRYERGTQSLNYDSLAGLNKPKLREPEKGKNNRSLSYAVLVSPSVGNQNMNFGTGVEVAYNISKNFSVSSGVSYAYVNAGANRNTPSPEVTPNYTMKGYNTSFASPSSPSTLSNTGAAPNNVQGVKLTLSGLEIPLSFQYKTKEGFYLSAGVSAMSVIGNNLSYDYLNSRAMSNLATDGSMQIISVVTEESTQRSNENVSGYIGFYTFSAGKKISFGRNKLNFAPFIKVPFSRISSENLQLMHGGVQLGFGF